MRKWAVGCALVVACVSFTALSDDAKACVPKCPVDLFLGTEGSGHVTPAATVPFGMIQAGPDTGVGKWNYCAGYQYSDNAILGFSQTHLSGTGCPDLGDVSIMPFTGEFDGTQASRFRKTDEKAGPGWYEVTLARSGIKVALSTSDSAAALRNLEAESADWDFKAVRAAATSKWNDVCRFPRSVELTGCSERV